jgi:hypothetical protein
MDSSTAPQQSRATRWRAGRPPQPAQILNSAVRVYGGPSPTAAYRLAEWNVTRGAPFARTQGTWGCASHSGHSTAAISAAGGTSASANSMLLSSCWATRRRSRWCEARPRPRSTQSCPGAAATSRARELTDEPARKVAWSDPDGFADRDMDDEDGVGNVKGWRRTPPDPHRHGAFLGCVGEFRQREWLVPSVDLNDEIVVRCRGDEIRASSVGANVPSSKAFDNDFALHGPSAFAGPILYDRAHASVISS